MTAPVHRVTGKFDVQMAPQPASEMAAAAQVGRTSLDKRYHGALDAVGQGEMLSARNDAMAAYVALERVSGTLEGKRGSFYLTHIGTMGTAGKALTVHIVPGSGTEELRTVQGRMDIQIESGQHLYVLEYSL